MSTPSFMARQSGEEPRDQASSPPVNSRYWSLGDLLELEADDAVFRTHGVGDDVKKRLLEDVQANILKGVRQRYTLYTFLTFRPGADKKAIVRWLSNIPLTSALDQNAPDNREAITLLLSYQGYEYFCDRQKIGYLIPLKDDDIIAFREGLACRCPQAFGDDRRSDLEPNYRNPSHALILIASDDERLKDWNGLPEQEDRDANLWAFFLGKTTPGDFDVENAVENRFFEIGMRNPDGSNGPARDWFGFRDGISNPRFFPNPDSTLRQPDPPATLNTVLRRNTLSPKPYACGSFAVFLKLRQNKAAFDNMTGELIRRLGLDEYAGYAAAYIMGRHKDGTPLHRSYGHPAPEDAGLNSFDFRDDKEGQICPLNAHIRKANPRDGRDWPRITRRGKIYGSPDSANRGILFFSYQSSLRAFEDIVNRGLYGYNHNGKHTGRDLLFAEKGEYQANRIYRRAFGQSRNVSLLVDEKPVTFLGGQYFFASSISFIRVNLENCM